jgi:hypothetical protein
MLEIAELGCDRRVDLRMRVPEQVDLTTSDGVEIAAAVEIVSQAPRPRAIGTNGQVSCRFICVHGCQTAARLRAIHAALPGVATPGVDFNSAVMMVGSL